MATSTFDTPLVLTKKGINNLIALMKKWDADLSNSDGIKPYSYADREKAETLIWHLFS